MLSKPCDLSLQVGFSFQKTKEIEHHPRLFVSCPHLHTALGRVRILMPQTEGVCEGEQTGLLKVCSSLWEWISCGAGHMGIFDFHWSCDIKRCTNLLNISFLTQSFLSKCDFSKSGHLLFLQGLENSSSVVHWCSENWCFMSFSIVIFGVTAMLFPAVPDGCSSPNVMWKADVDRWAPLGFSVLLYKAWSRDLQEIHTCSFQSMGLKRNWVSLFSSKHSSDYSRMGSLVQPLRGRKPGKAVLGSHMLTSKKNVLWHSSSGNLLCKHYGTCLIKQRYWMI